MFKPSETPTPAYVFDSKKNDWVVHKPSKFQPKSNSTNGDNQEGIPNIFQKSKQSLGLYSRYLGQELPKVSKYSKKGYQENIKDFNVFTLNVWFDFYYKKERCLHVLDSLKKIEADVICLQEVTSNFWKNVLNDSYVREHYIVSDNQSCITFTAYGVTMLINKDKCDLVKEFFICGLPTRMNRRFVKCSITKKDSKLDYPLVTIGTVHLESLSSGKLRRAQLELICNSYLNSDLLAIVTGDFNFDSERNYFKDLPPLENSTLSECGICRFLDMWSYLYPEEKGITYDSTQNPMIKHSERMRYDRIIVKTGQAFFTNTSQKNVSMYKVSSIMKPMDDIYDVLIPHDIKIYGRERIPLKNVEDIVLPSDHFGLEGYFHMYPIQFENFNNIQKSLQNNSDSPFKNRQFNLFRVKPSCTDAEMLELRNNDQVISASFKMLNSVEQTKIKHIQNQSIFLDVESGCMKAQNKYVFSVDTNNELSIMKITDNVTKEQQWDIVSLKKNERREIFPDLFKYNVPIWELTNKGNTKFKMFCILLFEENYQNEKKCTIS